MTKTQIWIAAFVVVFLALFFLGKVFKVTEDEPALPMGSNQGTENVSGADDEVKQLLARNACVNCHGQNLEGTMSGPALTNIKENWTSKNDLINYLRNPSAFMDKGRFAEYKKQYSTDMPAYENIDVKDLGKIADFLLK